MEKETKYKIVIAILITLLIVVFLWVFLLNYDIMPKQSHLTGFDRLNEKYNKPTDIKENKGLKSWFDKYH